MLSFQFTCTHFFLILIFHSSQCCLFLVNSRNDSSFPLGISILYFVTNNRISGLDTNPNWFVDPYSNVVITSNCNPTKTTEVDVLTCSIVTAQVELILYTVKFV